MIRVYITALIAIVYFCFSIGVYAAIGYARAYSIQAQPLHNALIEFAKQSDVQILLQVDRLPEVDVRAFKGRYLPKKLLQQLLLGTNLSYSFGEHGVILIIPKVAKSSNLKPVILPVVSYQDNRLEEVEVVGIRSSLRRNLEYKRDSGSIVDVITAEGIGKFPDKNVADSLQRIPGISVDRIWGEGRDINIRGTDKDVNRTLMNGQNVASGYWWANDNPSRGFNYSILASELVARLEVYKSPEADIDEGSIGGTVIIHTRRPFDLPAQTLQASVEGIYSELPDSWNPQVALLGSWKNTAQSFGMLASIHYQTRTLRRDGLEAFPDNNLYNFSDTQGNVYEDILVPWGMGSAIFQQERKRITGNITVQWQPVEALQLVFNSVYSDMNMDNQNQNYLSVPGGFKFSQQYDANPGDLVVENPQFINVENGRPTLSGGVLSGVDTPGAAIDAIFRESYIQTQVYDLDGVYEHDNWNIHAQLGFTQATGGSDHDRLYRFVGNTREQYRLDEKRVEFSFPDLDPMQAKSLDRLSAETHDWVRRMQDSEQYAQMDWTLGLDWKGFEQLKIGVKWRDHSIENNREVGEINTQSASWARVQNIGLEALSSSVTPYLHQQAASTGSLIKYAWVDQALTESVLLPEFDKGLMQYRFDKGAYYRIEEKISALYAKGNFTYGLLRGNIGLRWVNTEQYSEAWQGRELISNRRDYIDWLPSLNGVYQYTENFLIRGALSRVMARPTFPNLTPSVIIDATDGTASGGNPNLEPFRANQWELGGEWYFQEASLLAATWFYKDMSSFVFTERSQEQVNGQTIAVFRPQNGPGADIQGLELQWQQHLAWDFGALANYTYTDAKVPTHSGIESLSLPGNSRDQVNASLYYEGVAISARLSWNYRSDSFGGFSTGSQDVTEAYDQWDASASWLLSEELSVYMEAVNLLNEVVYYRTANGIPQGIYENGRRFSLGLRLKM